MLTRSLTDSQLAARARDGDGVAFRELVSRYQGLIAQTIRGQAFGLTAEDQRQEALIGLYLACRAHDPIHGRFGGMATVCVRRHVWQAQRKARARKHRVLTEALGIDHPAGPVDERMETLAETLPAAAGADPAVVVELRDELRHRAARRQDTASGPSAHAAGARRSDEASWPRRYSDAEIATALALVAEGRTLREAGAAVGASHPTVLRWLGKAA